MKHKTDLYVLAVALGVLASSATTFAADGSDPGPRRGHHHPKLTETQKACLKEQGLQPPGEGPRPDRSKVEAVFKACNIPAPSHPRKQGDDGGSAPDTGDNSVPAGDGSGAGSAS